MNLEVLFALSFLIGGLILAAALAGAIVTIVLEVVRQRDWPAMILVIGAFLFFIGWAGYRITHP